MIEAGRAVNERPRTFAELFKLLLLAETRLFAQDADCEDMVPCDPLVALDRIDVAQVLDGKVLSDGPCAVSEERVGRGEGLGRKEVVKEVVEGAMQYRRRPDV